jgi:hypothetical protein
MARAHPQQPLIVACELCDARIPTFRRSAWIDAIDHALDEHRAKLLASPGYARRWFRITHQADGRPARLTPTPP